MTELSERAKALIRDYPGAVNLLAEYIASFDLSQVKVVPLPSQFSIREASGHPDPVGETGPTGETFAGEWLENSDPGEERGSCWECSVCENNIGLDAGWVQWFEHCPFCGVRLSTEEPERYAREAET